MKDVPLPESLCQALVEGSDDMLFNVVGYCFDILLQRIAPKYHVKRERKRVRKQRCVARKAAAVPKP
jgi:hypothetical protein